MKKNFVTSSFIVIFVIYALYQYFGTSGTLAYVANNTSPRSASVPSQTTQPIITEKKATSVSVNNTTTQTPPSQPKVAPTVVPTPPPVVKKNLYADGTFTGSVADAYYGNIQVQTTIQNGKIVNIQFLQYPSDRSTSRRINSIADPQLASEAISVQSSNVDIVSGATDSSQAFIQSLDSTLTQAKNS